jgi:hypothetical protein
LILIAQFYYCFDPTATGWPNKLIAINIGLILGFLIDFALIARREHACWMSTKFSLMSRWPIRRCVHIIGFFTIAQALILVGLLTKNPLAVLGYVGVALAPFVFLNTIPKLLKNSREKKRLKETMKKEAAAQKEILRKEEEVRKTKEPSAQNAQPAVAPQGAQPAATEAKVQAAPEKPIVPADAQPQKPAQNGKKNDSKNSRKK